MLGRLLLEVLLEGDRVVLLLLFLATLAAILILGISALLGGISSRGIPAAGVGGRSIPSRGVGSRCIPSGSISRRRSPISSAFSGSIVLSGGFCRYFCAASISTPSLVGGLVGVATMRLKVRSRRSPSEAVRTRVQSDSSCRRHDLGEACLHRDLHDHRVRDHVRDPLSISSQYTAGD